MSKKEIPFFRMVYPTSDLNEAPGYAILDGPDVTTYAKFPTSNASDSAITWQINVPTPSTIIDRKIYIGIPIQVTGTVAAAIPLAAPSLIGFTEGLRSYAPYSAIENIQITLNQCNITLSPSDIIPCLMWYGTQNNEEAGVFSTMPTYPDPGLAMLGAKNPFNSYSASRNREVTRGELNPVFLANALNAVQFQATYLLYFPLILSPFIFGNMEEPGFIHVRSFLLTLQWGDLNKIWEKPNALPMNAQNPYINFTVTTQNVQNIPANTPFSSPTVFLKFLTPHADYPIKDAYEYSFYQPIKYIKTTGNIAGVQTNLSTDSYTFPMFPERIYIWLMFSKSIRDYTYPDLYCAITKCVINFNNVAGVLSSATQYDLYLMSQDNGLQMTWSQFQGSAFSANNQTITTTCGSIICIRPGKDIGLTKGCAPGVIQQVSFQATLDIITPTINALPYDILIVPILPGKFSLSQEGAKTELGIVSVENASNLGNLRKIDYRSIKNLYGGNWWGDVKGWFSKAKDWVGNTASKAKDWVDNKAIPWVEKAVDTYKKVAPVVTPLLMGLGKKRKHDHLEHHHHKKLKHGGKLLSLKQLNEENEE